jgi:ABC-type amino acid transport substrate-binding protein
MRKKLSLLLGAVLATSSVLIGGGAQAATSTKPAKVDYHLVKAGNLIVGMTLQFRPEMYLDSKGKPAGYDVQLVTALAKSLGLKLVIKNLDFGGLIPGLMSRQFDMLSVGLTNNPERAKSITFAREYMPYATVLTAKVGQTIGGTFEAWNKAGIKITALQGSTAAKLVKSTFPNATLVEFPEQSAAFLEVASGRADGIVVEANLSGDYIKSNPGQLVNVALPKLIDVGYGSWAVQLGNTSLKSALNKFICTNQKNGTFAKIHLKTMGYPLPALPAC